MSVRRCQVHGRRRAAQRPHLPLPQLPEGDGLAVLCPRAVRPAGAFGRRRNGALSYVGGPRPGVLQGLRHAAVSRRTNGTVVGVALAAFDDRNAFAPTAHIWVSEKIDWVRLDDGLRQYQETVPQ